MNRALGPPAKLLLVDDNPGNLLALEAVLGETEYILIKASSGPEALSLLRQHPDVALILLDVQMPIMDGFEVSQKIRSTPGLQEIPIVFITAIYKEDPFVLQGFKAGAIDYFSKPFDPEVLKHKVRVYASFVQRANMLKEREQQMKKSEELLAAGRQLAGILESLPIGVIIADADGRVCQVNEEVLKILKAIEQTKSGSYGEFLSWWERDGHHIKGPGGPLMRALSEGQASHKVELKIKCLDGTSKAVFASASPLRSLDHQIAGAVVVLQDITAHREFEADIEKRIINLVSLGVELQDVTTKE